MEHFSIVDDHAEYRPTGQVSIPQMAQLVTSAISFARDQQIRKLLVVTTGLAGFPSPGLGSRFFFIEEWARVARGVVVLALVVRPEMIEPQKFGVDVATNRGLRSDVFGADSEEEALSWLKSHE